MIRKSLAALAIGVFAIGGSLLAAPAASADSVWFQSVARASATAPCPDASFGTPWQSNWNPAEQAWRPSWAQWANNGAGGYTCDRQITWATNGAPAYPSAGCVAYTDGIGIGTKYLDFGGGWSLGTAPRYDDAACTSPYAWGFPPSTGPIVMDVVYAPSGWSAADLCAEAFPDPLPSERTRRVTAAGSNGVYYCTAVFA